ncbi:protein DpdE [Akkermansiaceae bacterium]|nr:protein DpdE [Akkermansiaceae bacterium]MDB4356905.1 protein DpdE [Akkermansiaceae bacterium]
MPNPHIGKFVRSSVNDFGIGKIFESDADTAMVEYFDTPTATESRIDSVPFTSLKKIELQRQTRVYYYDKLAGFWRMGRVEAHVEDAHIDGQVEDVIYIALPNKEKAVIRSTEVFVRWDRPLSDPWSHLEGRLTETPYFHNARSELIAELTGQRAASSGMTALLSSPIELEPHQIEVVNRVLKDPCQRYLLADEVGLGKTIEAGVILRQHILDNPDTHAALIVVPEGLASQWTEELRDRCQVSPELFGHSVEVLTYSEAIEWQGDTPDFLIVDEAHQVASNQELFDRIRQMSDPDCCPKLLLLSATPVLRNEKGFLSLLHLLDPLVNRLEDVEAFRERVANRQELANLFGEFVEEQDAYHLPTVIQDLREHFPKDQRLTNMLKEVEEETLKCQDAGSFENSEELKRTVGKARNHLSESYRLHRRILRNRRNEALEEVLTGRDSFVPVVYEDQGSIELESALENWREEAVASLWGKSDPETEHNLAMIFWGLLEAAWCEPEVVFDLIRLRKGHHPSASREYGPLFEIGLQELARETPIFENEEVALDRILALENLLVFSRQARLKRLGKTIQDVNATDGRIERIVFFATSPSFADDLYEYLVQTFGEKFVTRHSVGSSDWQIRWKRKGPQFLVCDWTAEEGLNLQGGSTALIHLDLPLSPNRVEQRIGRLDRFGVGNPVISFALETSESRFASGWQKCLDDGWKIFSNSIAALQYVVDEEMKALTLQLFMEGTEAIDAATTRLAAKEGIQNELRLIRNQDALDAIETSYREDSKALIDRLDEVSANSEHFGEVVDSWTLNRLHFERVGQDERYDTVFRYHYQSSDRGSQTLISRDDFLRWFEQAVDSGAVHREFRQPLSYKMAFSRQKARARKVGLARLGSPWIDSLSAYARQDDRGSAFALWRVVDANDLPDGELHRTFFRFDYLIEANFKEDENPALKRKADAAFPPTYKTLWIDQDLAIPEEDLLDWLEEPYCSTEDKNIRAEYWPHVLQTLEIQDWVGLCAQVRSVAESILREQTNLKSVIAECVSCFEGEMKIVTEQAKSRLEVFGDQHQGLEKELEAQLEEGSRVQSAISQPKVRLDSCGAVFLSSRELEIPTVEGGDQ